MQGSNILAQEISDEESWTILSSRLAGHIWNSTLCWPCTFAYKIFPWITGNCHVEQMISCVSITLCDLQYLKMRIPEWHKETNQILPRRGTVSHATPKGCMSVIKHMHMSHMYNFQVFHKWSTLLYEIWQRYGIWDSLMTNFSNKCDFKNGVKSPGMIQATSHQQLITSTTN